MAATSLVDWPNELHVSILALLSLTDLRSMTIVNHQFRALTEPLLYSKIETTWTWHRTPPVTLLLRSILDRPELSNYIRCLRLDSDSLTEGHYRIKELPPFPLTTPLISKASTIVESTGVAHAELWIDELHSGTVDAVVTLLLSMLPNLTSLHLGPIFAIRSRLLGMMLTRDLCKPSENYQPSTFRRLRHVTFSRRANEYSYRDVNNTADVLPFFYLPEIQCLSISIDNPAEFVWPAHAPTPSSLTSLELYRLREARLRPLLSVLHRLQRLHWHCYYQPDLDQHVSKDIIELDTISIALNQVRDTLTDLTIEAETCPELLAGSYEPPRLETRASLDGMVHLGKLTRLCIPWVFLMGFSAPSTKNIGDALPSSLKLLILTAELEEHEEWEWEDSTIISAIKSGLESRTVSCLTNLHSIILPIPIGYSKMTDERKGELGRIGAHAGVHLGWTDK